jgi:hypothetical protein
MEFLLAEALSNSGVQGQILGLNFASAQSFHIIHIHANLGSSFFNKYESIFT